jgi:hypothetical protein
MPSFDELKWMNVADYALGTWSSTARIGATFEMSRLDEAQIEQRLLALGIQRCAGCGWWIRSSELDTDADERPCCTDCFE